MYAFLQGIEDVAFVVLTYINGRPAQSHTQVGIGPTSERALVLVAFCSGSRLRHFPWTMHDHHTPPELRPPYNVPMALEESLTRTKGIGPELVRARNRKVVEDSKTYTLGPMPIHEFMGDFLKVPHPCDEVDLLSNRHAFSRVPTRARTVEGLCTYLVSSGARRTYSLTCAHVFCS